MLMLMLMLVLVFMTVVITVIATVTITAAALRLSQQDWLVYVTVHALTLHVVMGMAWVMRCVRVTRFVSLRREKGMVNLLKV